MRETRAGFPEKVERGLGQIAFVSSLTILDISRLAFALSHTLAPTSGTISPKTSGTRLLSLPSKANSRHFSSQNISVKPHCPSLLSVCTVCVCVCMCVGISSIVFKNPCQYLLLLFLITFSISMYIMCVCLFSALSHRVGALQISIIIIIIKRLKQ